MAKNNFSGLSHTGGGGAPSVFAGAPQPWWQRLPLKIIGAIVVVIVVIGVLAAACGGDSADPAAEGADGGSGEGIRSAHGPATIVDGVPRGYTRDEAGARTAAVNIVQAMGEARSGRIKGDDVRATAVAATASPVLNEVLADSSNRQIDTDKGTYSLVPLIVTTTNFSKDSATVDVWAMSIAQDAVDAANKIGILTLYSTTTVTVVWEGDDWKATDWKFRSGPDEKDVQFPAEGSPLSREGGKGFYTFYID